MGAFAVGRGKDDAARLHFRRGLQIAFQSQLAQKTQALAGNGVPADFIAGEFGLIEQQRLQAVAPAIECGGRACRSTAHHDDVVFLLAGIQNRLLIVIGNARLLNDLRRRGRRILVRAKW